MGGETNVSFIYAPFGEIIEATDAGAPSNGISIHRRRMNDKFVDELSDLAYYGVRYYDKLSLTWTQSDPLYRLAPDAAWSEYRRANLYVFTLQNPLRYIDPDGRSPLSTWKPVSEAMQHAVRQSLLESAAATSATSASTQVVKTTARTAGVRVALGVIVRWSAAIGVAVAISDLTGGSMDLRTLGGPGLDASEPKGPGSDGTDGAGSGDPYRTPGKLDPEKPEPTGSGDGGYTIPATQDFPWGRVEKLPRDLEETPLETLRRWWKEFTYPTKKGNGQAPDQQEESSAPH